ncbi:MAG: cytochrome P450 [Gammaproteobacteria bacterium]|nr:cytochrome P450 [Gammaproteobacteria bacterium]
MPDDDLNLMSAEEMADPSISARRLHAGPRVRFYQRFDPPFFILSRYQDVEAVLRDPQTFVSGHGQGPNFAPPSGVVSDPPDHTFFRDLVQPAFLPRAISERRPRLEAIAEELLDQVVEKPEWDLHDALGFPLPVMIICEILGIAARDIERYKKWSDSSVAALSAQDPTPYLEDQLAMRTHVRDLIHQRRDEPDDGGLLWRIAAAKRRGEPLADDEATGLVLQLFVAGNETTTSLISNFVWRFLSIAGLWPAFCRGEIDLDRAINESLRYDPPLIGLFRTTTRAVEIADTTVPARTKVMTHYLAANRDSAVFEDPHRFDPLRQGRKHLSFGLGIHVCLGMELAKLEARIALDVLRRRCPDLRLVNDGERIGPFLFWGRRKLPVTIDCS